MITFLLNLFSIITRVPKTILLLKTIMDITGSEAVQSILETIQDVVRKFRSDEQTHFRRQSEHGQIDRRRGGRLERLKLCIGQRLLGLNDSQFEQTMIACGKRQSTGEDKPERNIA